MEIRKIIRIENSETEIKKRFSLLQFYSTFSQAYLRSLFIAGKEIVEKFPSFILFQHITGTYIFSVNNITEFVLCVISVLLLKV
jgi:hypothetical protein